MTRFTHNATHIEPYNTNGILIKDQRGRNPLSVRSFINPNEIETIARYWLHQQGIWAHPDHPTSFVNRLPQRDDHDGECIEVYTQGKGTTLHWQDLTSYPTPRDHHNEQIAYDYFQAHPAGIKPWHHPAPGETWTLTLTRNGKETTCTALVNSDRDYALLNRENNIDYLHRRDPAITEGKKQ